MSTVAQRLNGDAPHGDRQAGDFYPTPRAGTDALLRVERFVGPIWEPACGDGAICRVLAENGYSVIATDLVDRGFGEAGIDFLDERQMRAQNIITNPPFAIAAEFVQTAINMRPAKIAMLMQLRFLEGIRRGTIFENYPPSRVWVFRKRLAIASGPPEKIQTLFGTEEQLAGTKGGMLAFAWFIWDQAHTGKCELDWV